MLFGPAIIIALDVPLHEVESTIKSSPNDAASAKLPMDAFSDFFSPSFLSLSIQSTTSFFEISRVPIFTW
jgi:hypothetical protein